MKNAKRKSGQIIYEFITIVLFCAFLILSVLVTFNVITLPEKLILTYPDNEDLFINLFTIQATVSTLSIAVVALITGFFSENIYGISVIGYITSIRPWAFKHKNLILFDLIIIAVNYYLVSMKYYNISIVIFIMSIAISCILVKDISVIFKGKNNLNNEIHDYILANYKKYIPQLHKEILTNAESGNITLLYSDLDLLVDIFDAEITKANELTETVKNLENILGNLFKDFYIRNSTETNIKILSCIYRFYEIANKDENNIIPLDIWYNTYHEYFNALDKFNYNQLTDHPKFNFELYRAQLIKNRVIEANEEGNLIQKNGYGLEYYSYYIYDSVLNNSDRKLTNEQIDYLKKRIYGNIYSDLFFRFDREQFKNEKYLLLTEFCYLIRLFIEKGESDFLNTQYFSELKCGNNRSCFSVSFVISMIYIYYVTQRESLYNGKEEKLNACEVLKKSRGIFKDLIYYIDLKWIMENHYKFLKNLLNSWERFENGKAKTLIMEPTIVDFIIFFSLEKYLQEKEIYDILKLITNKSYILLYSRYFDNDASNIKDVFEKFTKEMFGIDDDNHTESKTQLLKSALSKICKEESISQGIENKITKSSLQMLSYNLRMRANSISDEILKPFMKSEKPSDTDVRKKVCIFNDQLSNYSINDSRYLDYFESLFPSVILNTLLRYIRPSLIVKKVKFDNKSKQRKLIALNEEYSKGSNVYIGNRDTFYDEDDPELLMKYTSKMTHYSVTDGYNKLFLIDSNLIYFDINNIEIEYLSFDESNVDNMADVKHNGDEILYNISNGLYVPFDKKELIDHLNRTRQTIRIVADIEYKLLDNTVGSGIEITFD